MMIFNKIPAQKKPLALNKCKILALILSMCALSPITQAGSAVFSTTNIQYLHGSSYADFNPGGGFSDDDKSDIITVEHFNAWKYGDNFFFIDITNPLNEGDVFGSTQKSTAVFYGEISPRLSLGKLFNSKLAWGPIADVLLTSTVEIPEAPVAQTYLYGLAVDLKIPHFQFFQVNLYVRNSRASGVDTGQQLTLVWGLPFNISTLPLVFEGFFDYAWGEDPIKENIITAPRLLVDVGKITGMGEGKIQAGIEYQIWRNKFGIDGMDEDVPQAMVKWIW